MAYEIVAHTSRQIAHKIARTRRNRMPKSALRMSDSDAVNCLLEKAEMSRIPHSASHAAPCLLLGSFGDEFLSEPQRPGLFVISRVTRRLKVTELQGGLFYCLVACNLIRVCDKAIPSVNLFCNTGQVSCQYTNRDDGVAHFPFLPDWELELQEVFTLVDDSYEAKKKTCNQNTANIS